MPTRTGYVFLGWHGRNLVKPSDFVPMTWDYGTGVVSKLCVPSLDTADETRESENYDGLFYYTLTGTKAGNGADTDVPNMLNRLKLGSTYYLSCKSDDNSRLVRNFYIQRGDTTLYTGSEYTITSSDTYVGVYIRGWKDETYDNFKIYPMLTEGYVPGYEPYYIQPNTEYLVQENTTLVAEWGKDVKETVVDSYNATFDSSTNTCKYLDAQNIATGNYYYSIQVQTLINPNNFSGWGYIGDEWIITKKKLLFLYRDGYPYVRVKANSEKGDAYIYFNLQGQEVGKVYMIEFEITARTISSVNSEYFSTFAVKDIHICKW